MHTRSRRYLMAMLVMVAAALIPNPASAAATVTVVASGFDSPRGVTFSHGRLLVAEAGTGGPVCDAAHTICIGLTSRISKVNTENGTHTPLVSGLYSAVEFHGGPPEALGAEDIAATGGRVQAVLGVFPQAFDSITCAAGDTACDAILAAARAEAGHLISVSSNGHWRSIASVGSFDFNYTANIPNQEHDANPYGLLPTEGGTYVADAGSNTLNFVSNRGKITILHHFQFPNPTGFPTDAVPTCIARTDDALWVADLSGHLFRVQGNNATQIPMPLLHHVTGCTADNSGNLYLVNMWTSPATPTPFSGTVVKFNAESGAASVVAGGMDFPNMIAVGPGGNLYVSADSICPATGIPGLCPKGGTLLKISVPSDDSENGD